MRISDWSSDVCSSDLRAGVRMALAHHDAAHRDEAQCADAVFLGTEDRGDDDVAPGLQATVGTQPHPAAQAVEGEHLIDLGQPHFPRSEEHTSELQSLMRISYAGSCLKKKKDSKQKLPHNEY